MVFKLVQLLGKIYLMLIAYTCRIRVVNKDNISPFWNSGQNVIYALWHSRIIFLVAYYIRYRRKKTNFSTIVSHSRDGEYIARILESIGFLPVRGSSSMGGSKAFSQLLSLGKNGKYDLAVTPDGPRGPRELVKPGIIELGQKSGLPIIPVSYGSSLKKIFNSWDKFLLPFPFSRIVMVFGKPIKIKSDADDNGKKNLGAFLSDVLKDITRQADEMVTGVSLQRRPDEI